LVGRGLVVVVDGGAEFPRSRPEAREALLEEVVCCCGHLIGVVRDFDVVLDGSDLDRFDVLQHGCGSKMLHWSHFSASSLHAYTANAHTL